MKRIMADFIEIGKGKATTILNTDQIVSVEQKQDDNCIIKLKDGSEISSAIKYSSIKRWLEPHSHIVD